MRPVGGILVLVLAGCAASRERPAPEVLFVVDTSGSMEYLPGCVCESPLCSECLPTCDEPAPQRSRWAIVREALGGSFAPFRCRVRTRTEPEFAGELDYHYYLPHAAPPGLGAQGHDGVLETYEDRIWFGLATFDHVGTLAGHDPLVPEADWTLELREISDGAPGMFSFGGPRRFTLAGADGAYLTDLGIRTDTLVFPSPSGAERIRTRLAELRPFGPSPLGAAVDDLRDFYDREPGGGRDTCFGSWVVLFTDGVESADFRGEPYNCDSPGSTCPFPRPEEAAAELCRADASGRCTGRVRGVFVVAFSSATGSVEADAVATAGGTGTAFRVANTTELAEALRDVLDRILADAAACRAGLATPEG